MTFSFLDLFIFTFLLLPFWFLLLQCRPFCFEIFGPFWFRPLLVLTFSVLTSSVSTFLFLAFINLTFMILTFLFSTFLASTRSDPFNFFGCPSPRFFFSLDRKSGFLNGWKRLYFLSLSYFCLSRKPRLTELRIKKA